MRRWGRIRRAKAASEIAALRAMLEQERRLRVAAEAAAAAESGVSAQQYALTKRMNLATAPVAPVPAALAPGSAGAGQPQAEGATSPLVGLLTEHNALQQQSLAKQDEILVELRALVEQGKAKS